MNINFGSNFCFIWKNLLNELVLVMANRKVEVETKAERYNLQMPSGTPTLISLAIELGSLLTFCRNKSAIKSRRVGGATANRRKLHNPYKKQYSTVLARFFSLFLHKSSIFSLNFSSQRYSIFFRYKMFIRQTIKHYQFINWGQQSTYRQYP